MATKLLTDKTSAQSTIALYRNGADFGAQVEIRAAVGASVDVVGQLVTLDAARVLALIPATAFPNGTTRRAALLELYNLLYNGALVDAGYTP